MASKAQLKKLDELTPEQRQNLAAGDFDFSPENPDPVKATALLARLEEIGVIMGASDPAVKREGLEYLRSAVVQAGSDAKQPENEAYAQESASERDDIEAQQASTPFDGESAAPPIIPALEAVVENAAVEDRLQGTAEHVEAIPSTEVLEEVAPVAVEVAENSDQYGGEALRAALNSAIDFCEVKYMRVPSVSWYMARLIEISEEKDVPIEDLVRALAEVGNATPQTRTLLVG